MPRKGNCYNNSRMRIPLELGNQNSSTNMKFENVNHIKQELEKYIIYDNTKWIITKFKMSPVQYRTHFEQAA